ncbi:PKD domain-containing protein, partial [candidate division KSB1 bacterium]|nr:PKD domain-containing protein [candidate division KSB1 bacterium]
FVWLWDFGDGNTSILQNPSNTYSTIDSFAVTLTVIGPGGVDVLTRPDYIVTSGLAPTAGFTADTTHGAVPLQVKFTDESIGLVDAWSWDFGDGKTSAEQHPVHQYTTVDTFTVNLIASGQSGADTLVRPDYITVLEPPPVADFTADTTEGATPFEVQFTDQSSGMVLSWLWDFGDGNTSTNQNPSHLFQDADTFDVTLTVAGPGGEDTKTRTAYIITSDPSGVDNQNNRIPAEFALLQNYPNPFNASTTINYAVPEPSEIRLAVYNVRGECVCELVNGPHGPGVYQAHLDASELGSGLYFYRMESNAMKDNAVLIRKMILLK